MPQGGKLKSNPHKAKSTTQKKQQPKKGRQSPLILPSLGCHRSTSPHLSLSPPYRTSDPTQKGCSSIASNSPQGESTRSQPWSTTAATRQAHSLSVPL